MQKILVAALAALFAISGALVVAGPAQAGTTTAVSTSTTGIIRGSVLPNFSVTVGDDSGQISGATLQILDTWKLNPALRASGATMSPGTCGIDSISDGSNNDVPLADLKCTYRPGGSSSWSASISFGPADTNAATTYPSPLTVHFSTGVFTAPPFASATTQWRVLARNDDSGVTGLPVTLTFNVVSATVEPELQSISCEQGQEVESKPITTTGLTGDVTYSFTADPPTGVTINEITGVISGTPTQTPSPTIWYIAIHSSHGQVGTAQIYVNQALPNTGLGSAPIFALGAGLLLAGCAAFAIRKRRHGVSS